MIVDDGDADISEIQLYVFGVPELISHVGPQAIFTSNIATVTIGGTWQGVTDFRGLMDDLRVANRVLGIEEVTKLASQEGTE